MKLVYCIIGVDRRNKGLAEHLASTGHSLRVVNVMRCWAPAGIFDKPYEGPRLPPALELPVEPAVRARSPLIRLACSLPKMVRTICRTARELDAEFILCHNAATQTALACWVAARILHIPWVADYCATVASSPTDQPLRQKIEDTFLRLADGVLVTTQAMASHLVNDLGIAPARIHRLPTGSDDSLYTSPAAKPDAYRAKYKLGDDYIFLLSGAPYPTTVRGQPVDLLDVATAVCAFAIAAPQMPKAKLLLGLTRGDAGVDAAVKQANLGDRIVFSERYRYFTEEHYSLLALADVHLLTMANHPAKILFESAKATEYMWFGKPIIASDTPSCREVLLNTGCYYHVEDAASMAGQMVHCYEHREEAAARGRAAKELLTTRWNWAIQERPLLDFLRGITIER